MRPFIRETAAFGFIDVGYRDDREPWVAHTQKPFRAHSLWLFGTPDAVLTSITIAGDEQLLQSVPFGALFRPIYSAKDVAGMLHKGEHDDLMNIANRRCQSTLLYTPLLDFPTQEVGAQLRLATKGLVQGVLLVGEQLS